MVTSLVREKTKLERVLYRPLSVQETDVSSRSEESWMEADIDTQTESRGKDKFSRLAVLQTEIQPVYLHVFRLSNT